jgi:nudix-type nucleoside diphosphatase (YffH/AdpP family)
MTNEKEPTAAAAPGDEILQTHTAYAGWTRLLIATVRLSDGRVIRREVEDHGEAVCVLPYNPQRKTAVLVRQLRAPLLLAGNQQGLFEAIAGILEDEETDASVRRESMEEAQLKLDSLERVFTAWTMPGLSTERMHLYLATYSGEPRPEIRGGIASEHEETIATEIGLPELVRMAESGVLADLKTLLLLQTLRLRRPDLFSSST